MSLSFDRSTMNGGEKSAQNLGRCRSFSFIYVCGFNEIDIVPLSSVKYPQHFGCGLHIVVIIFGILV
jgi:hypothetical protein